MRRVRFDGSGSRPEDRGHRLARQALRRAISHGEPSMGAVLGRVPSLLAEASRRRLAAGAAESPGVEVSRAARAWLPRLAAITALLVLTALLVPGRGTSDRAASVGTASDEAASLDSWLVTGAPPSRVSDPVLDALVR